MVDAMFSDSRNSVVNSSSDGNVDSDSAEGMYIATISSTRLTARLAAISRSSSGVGSGSTNSATIAHQQRREHAGRCSDPYGAAPCRR